MAVDLCMALSMTLTLKRFVRLDLLVVINKLLQKPLH